MRALRPDVTVRCASEPAGDLLIAADAGQQALELLNRASIEQAVPLVAAWAPAVDRSDRSVPSVGSVATLAPYQPGQPCALCLLPATAGAPPDAALASLLGSLAAVEAVKLRLGIGEPLRGRRLTCSLDGGPFAIERVEPRVGCEGCKRGAA
jgi:hypothetical protein